MTGIAPNMPGKTLLSDAEVSLRVTLLTELQAALLAMGIQSLLARNRRLVLRSAGTRLEPSGPTDPQLHVFGDDGTEVVTTDGQRYEFTAGPECTADDPQAAAASLLGRLSIHREGQPR